jgi:hypothetical protein
MGGAYGAFGGGERVHRVLEEKLEGKRPLGRASHRLEDNIEMDV